MFRHTTWGEKHGGAKINILPNNSPPGVHQKLKNNVAYTLRPAGQVHTSGKNVTSRGRRADYCLGGGVQLLYTDQARPGPSGNNVASGGRRAGHRQGGGVPLLDNDPGGSL